MIETADEFSALPPRAAAIVVVAGLLAALGTLTGLAGLLMWGIKAFDLFTAQAGEAPALVERVSPSMGALNFALTLIITVCGLVNLLKVLRWQDFLGGEWRRYCVVSAVSLVAAALFVWTPDVV